MITILWINPPDLLRRHFHLQLWADVSQHTEAALWLPEVTALTPHIPTEEFLREASRIDLPTGVVRSSDPWGLAQPDELLAVGHGRNDDSCAEGDYLVHVRTQFGRIEQHADYGIGAQGFGLLG